MGKKQHSKDRMYITKTEWATEWGGAKQRDLRTPFKKLPFYCCALTFTPFQDPMCTKEGHVFDIMNIIPYIQKYGKNPVSGSPLSVKDLIRLQFHKNADGEYQCPVLHKVFTEFSHIVALKTSGNVFSYEAIKELNIKPKNWHDLLTDEPFSREDLITIQDPNALSAMVLSEFDHVKMDRKADDEELEKSKADPSYFINLSGDTKRMLQELGTERGREAANLGGGGGKARLEQAAALSALHDTKQKPRDERGKDKSSLPLSIVDAASAAVNGRSANAAKASSREKTVAHVAAHVAGELAPINTKLVKSRYSSGVASRSFTSTTYDPVTSNAEEYVQAEKNPKKKGYVRLHTTHGDLNIELHCDLTPRTCENFITHCDKGYYNNINFHRSIRNFMIQGGDPTGTGRGGESIWGKPFKDELNSKLLHTGRGIVSMANSGPHSNGSQFFILYKSAPHLNYKHTVFGRVVGGLETLSVMEKVPVDDDDRPLEEIKILQISVFVNPYTEPDEEEEKQKDKEERDALNVDADNERIGSWYSNPNQGEVPVAKGAGVGKYLKQHTSVLLTKTADAFQSTEKVSETKKRKVEVSNVQFKDFSAW
ncbi:hypothetical protein O6H91_13G072700 [Diphasiastrum complanatum]|uniref:Uncharacterized protein n=3 Tax=Diphasiastrum complanatum TaxID=34168 RepID=A0ACC2BW40_DIPCM|nr:hypothetical protein O6H91_13G072700 [Diphasiastrum complanatum]KAJ7533955.1 hypothetical protein O6H91_13G072700 [Diphasiastrum complanatum]KAJ7533956.1 hypothetical protein O6H91_13G072700 [Diphasiastrum complanatum]